MDNVKKYPLFRLLQKRSKELDSGWFIGIILMDISKAYECLLHDLLMVKLEANGLDNGSHNLFLDYLSFKKQWTKFGSTYSKWPENWRGIPKKSILGSI